MIEETKEQILERPKVDSKTADGRYKTIFEQVNGAAFLTTLEGQILEANQKSCELFGYGWSELLRLSLKDILSTETEWSQFKEEITSRGGLNIETESICKDGSYCPVEISISLFKMDRKPVMFVIIWDITERREAEKRLKESEKKYHGLFEYATDGIFVLDARGEIIDANTKLCEMLDLSKDNIIGKNLFSLDFLTEKSLPVVVNQFEQLLSEKTVSNYTTQIKTKHEKLLDVEVSSFFLIKKEKEVENFILIVRDITARNKADKMQMQEHELLKTLLDNIPESIYFKDDKNRFILVNKAKANNSKVSPEEMINKTDFDFMPEDQARKFFDDDSKIMLSGQPIINKIEKLKQRNGSERRVSVSKIPRFNSVGEIIGTMGISRDISAQKKAEEELLKSEEYNRAIFENLSFPIILVNEYGRIISWNKLAESLLNMSYDEINMKPVEMLYFDDDWEKIQAEYKKNDQSKQCMKIKIKDKNPVEVNLSVNVLKDIEGRVIGFTHIIYNIS